MIRTFSTYTIRPAGLLLAIVFATSLVWCGEAACRSGTSDDQCTSLICSLLDNHGTPDHGQKGNCSAECMCLCHMPTITGPAFDTEHDLTAQQTTFTFTASTPPSPDRSIYHPPKL